MGLGIDVGVLADLKMEDEEGYQYFKRQFAAINQALRDAELPDHNEPENPASPAPLEWDMIGYSGLHYLRRLAAYVAAGKGLPAPGDENAAKDSVKLAYYPSLAKLQERFDHLMLHSDAEGYYLPLRFEKVIFPNEQLEIVGRMIGSSQMLMEECQRLARMLDLPLDLDPEDETLYEAVQNQGKGKGWRRYGMESFACLRLYDACKSSVESGCAIVFR